MGEMDLLFMGGISVAWFGLIRLRAEALEPRKETGKAREGMKGSYRHVPRSHMGARVWEAARDQRLPVNSSWPINVTGRRSRFFDGRKESLLEGTATTRRLRYKNTGTARYTLYPHSSQSQRLAELRTVQRGRWAVGQWEHGLRGAEDWGKWTCCSWEESPWLGLG